MIYTFRVAGAFGKVHFEELEVEQIDLVKHFMGIIGPEIIRTSLQTDKDAKENAETTMRWAMYLAVQYETLRKIAEADTTQEQQAPAPGQQGPSDSAPRVQQEPTSVSTPQPPLHDLRKSGDRSPSQTRPHRPAP